VASFTYTKEVLCILHSKSSLKFKFWKQKCLHIKPPVFLYSLHLWNVSSFRLYLLCDLNYEIQTLIVTSMLTCKDKLQSFYQRRFLLCRI
jgi:hypothetical protein